MLRIRARLASMIVPLLVAACYWQAPIQSGTLSYVLGGDPASRFMTVLTVPSGLPADVQEELNDFSWFNANSTDIYLVIAGGNGLVLYPAGTYDPGEPQPVSKRPSGGV
jgi:hypothetical protein